MFQKLLNPDSRPRSFKLKNSPFPPCFRADPTYHLQTSRISQGAPVEYQGGFKALIAEINGWNRLEVRTNRGSMSTMFSIESSYRSMVGHPSLIDEKISIPAVTDSGSRVRLRGLLEKSLSTCTSTIISGRAGTGKTTLALDFAKNSGIPVAWYKVDAPEAEITSFFEYLIGSIQRVRPHFGGKVLIPLTKTADHSQISRLAEAFLYELVEDESQRLLIVIEDLHLVFDSEWLVPFLHRVLPLLPTEVHMIITSRTVPPAPLWRMRSKQTLSVIDEATLAFTRPEAIELFESFGLTSDEASVALAHTHGRAGALIRIATNLAQKESSQRISSVAYVA